MAAKKSRRLHRIEPLELRCLLAADYVGTSVGGLAVRHAEPGAASDPNAARIVHVFNDGSDTVLDVNVRSSITNEFEDVSWTRKAAFGRRMNFEPNADNKDSVFARYGGRMTPIGDINGDGFLDGTLEPGQVVFGGSNLRPFEDGFDGTNGFLMPPAIVRAAPTLLPIVGVGDINGDGFDDFRYGYQRTILGGKDIGGSGTLEDFSELEHVIGGSAAGDVNGDGFDDLVHQFEDVAFLIWGRADATTLNTFDTEQLSLNPDSSVAKRILGADRIKPVGDLNADGFDDVLAIAYGGLLDTQVHVIFGNRDPNEIASNVFELEQADGFAAGSYFHFGVHPDFPIATGDFNGDGISDLVFGDPGANICEGFCDHEYDEFGNFRNVTTGTMIFGREGLARTGELGSSDVITFEEDSYDLHLATVDINADGISDLQYNEYVVLGGPTLNGHQFGSITNEYELYGLNGLNGFRTDNVFASWTLPTGQPIEEPFAALVSHPGEAWQTVILPQLNGQSESARILASGTGDVREVIDFKPQTSYVYEVFGTRRTDANTIPGSRLVSSIGAAETYHGESLSDNAAGRRAAYITVDTDAPKHSTNERTDFELRVTNDGPHLAQGVRLKESFTSWGSNSSWKLDVFPFPPVVSLSDLSGFGVASFLGGAVPEDVAWMERFGQSVAVVDYNGDDIDDVVLQSNDDVKVFDGRARFGIANYIDRQVRLPQFSSAGDVNGDGFDDLLLNGSSSPRMGSWTVPDLENAERLWLGLGCETQPGESNCLFSETTTVNILQDAPILRHGGLGDINNDGFDDFAVVTETKDEVPMLRVFYGHENPFELPALGDLAGFQITSDQPFGTSVRTTSVGDLNEDGIDDFAILHADHFHFVFGKADRITGVLDLVRLSHLDGLRLDIQADDVLVEDINGDGHNDLIVGCMTCRENHGVVHVMLGPLRPEEIEQSDIATLSDMTMVGDQPDNSLGSSLATSDLDGDGIRDLAIGANNGVFVVYGEPDTPRELISVGQLDGRTGFRIAGEENSETRLAGRFDFNADGIDDLLIGRQRDRGGDGGIYLILGRRSESIEGVGAIDSSFDLPIGATAALSITTDLPVPELPARVPGVTMVSIDPSVVNLNPAVQSNASAVAPALQTESPFRQRIVVSYFAPEGLNRQTIGDTDIEIVLPDGQRAIPEFIDATNISDQSLDATYGLVAPGGSWDADDNGTYTIRVVADEDFRSTGSAIPSGSIGKFEVAIAAPGDIDGNQRVDFSDFLILSANYGQEGKRREQGDLNDDSIVNFADFLVLSANYSAE